MHELLYRAELYQPKTKQTQEVHVAIFAKINLEFLKLLIIRIL